MSIRPIDPTCAAEISLVARRMHDTLVEVEGPERGAAIHAARWLEERVRWHLDPSQCTAQVLVATDAHGAICGHTIFRIEHAGPPPVGLIATTYVVPSARRAGWASQLLDRAHAWFRGQGVSMCGTWTSGTNTALISMYEKAGYRIVDHGPNSITGTPMVKLGVRLDAPAP